MYIEKSVERSRVCELGFGTTLLFNFIIIAGNTRNRKKKGMQIFFSLVFGLYLVCVCMSFRYLLAHITIFGRSFQVKVLACPSVDPATIPKDLLIWFRWYHQRSYLIRPCLEPGRRTRPEAIEWKFVNFHFSKYMLLFFFL